MTAILTPIFAAEARLAERTPRTTWPERFLVDRVLPGLSLLLLAREAARTRGRVAPPAVLAGAVALVLGDVVKVAVRRQRPNNRSAAGLQRYSFPSTHAAVAIAVTTAGMSAARPWLTLVAHAAVLCAALGRIRDRRHYPSDTLAGLALGVATGVVARRIVRGPRENAPLEV